MEEYGISNYKAFANIVTVAIKRVEEERKYSYETFFNIVDLQIDVCGLYQYDRDKDNEYISEEEANYKEFCKNTILVIENTEKSNKTKQDYINAFKIIKRFIEEYHINELNNSTKTK